jgi:hypothetical protein
MEADDGRVRAELQHALDALTKASGHLDEAARAGTPPGLARRIEAANGAVKDAREEVSYVLRLARRGGDD